MKLSQLLTEETKTLKTIVMHNNEGTSDKVYIVNVFFRDNNYIVQAFWGRRPMGKEIEDVKPQDLADSIIKMETDSLLKAYNAAEKLKTSKAKKGYYIIREEDW